MLHAGLKKLGLKGPCTPVVPNFLFFVSSLAPRGRLKYSNFGQIMVDLAFLDSLNLLANCYLFKLVLCIKVK